jgi:stage II sporulation protein GA (sporulation sigma-E factor processing peptidase)
MEWLAVPVVYLDVVWLINFVLDGFLIWFTAWIGRFPLHAGRWLLGSAAGGMYAVVLVFPSFQLLDSLIAKIAFSFLIIGISFSLRSIRDVLRLAGLFYLVVFLTGGATLSLDYFIGGNAASSHGWAGMPGGREGVIRTPLWILAAAIPLTWSLARTVWRKAEGWWRRERSLWTIRVRVGEDQVEMVGLLDTGNHLRDPLSQFPVMVGDWRRFQSILPEGLLQVFGQHGDPVHRLPEVSLPEDWQTRLHLVPYRGIGGMSGMLIAFRPDEVVLLSESAIHTTSSVLIGLNPQTLSGDNVYQAILHPEMIPVRDAG